MSYVTVIILSWVTFLLVWAFTALGVKRDLPDGNLLHAWSRFWLLRLVAAAFFIFVALRIATGTAHYASPTAALSGNIFIPSLLIEWVAASLTALGIAFAIWARFHLGKNWSSHPAVKEGHELVTTGPYAFVRHPIYTGVVFAGIGSALTGNVFGVGMLVLIFVIFLSRIKKEEKIMLGLFPNQYPEYQRRTKRLIPFIW